MDSKQLIEKFITWRGRVDRETAEEIVKREDDEIYKELLEIVQKDEYWEFDEFEIGGPSHYAFIILGLKKSEKAFEILKYIITYRTEELGDWLTGDLPAVLYSFGIEYYDKIKDFAFDKSLDMSVRLAAINVLCAHGILNPAFREKTIEICKKFLREEEDKEAVALAILSMAEIRDEELFKMLKEAHKRCDVGPIKICYEHELQSIHEKKGINKSVFHTTKNLWEYFPIVRDELLEEFISSGENVNREIAEEIVKREDDKIYKGLLEIVQTDEYWKIGGPGEGWTPYHVFIILGLKKTEKAFEILKYIITHRTKELGDWLTEDLPAVFYSFGPEYYDKIKEFAFDRSIDPFVRLCAIEALCAHGVLNPTFKEKTIELCKQFIREEDEKDMVALALLRMAEIRDEELFEMIKEAHKKYDMGSIRICSEKELREIYEEKDITKKCVYTTKNLWDYFPIEVADNEDYEISGKRIKIGRNDPCPCGSGKKYKKCCGDPAKNYMR